MAPKRTLHGVLETFLQQRAESWWRTPHLSVVWIAKTTLIHLKTLKDNILRMGNLKSLSK